MRDQVHQPADAALVARVAAERGLAPAAARAWLDDVRAATMERQRTDPFAYGYEPDIWLVVKALMRGAQPNGRERRRVMKAVGLEWGEFSERLRKALGFAHAVGEVIVMGANRSGKTDFAAKLAIEIAMRGDQNLNIGFQSLPTGKQVQEPRVWNYLPKDLKKTVKTAEEYISYTKQNGFSGSKITFANGSGIRFVTYEMDVNAVMEGSALDFTWLDEESPKAFLDAARFRLASKRGTLLLTFTPVSGYTPVVADYLEGMAVTKWHTAYMLPLDGKEPLPWKELGLEEHEWRKLQAWRDAGGTEDPCVPEARPENCCKWILGDTIGEQVTDGRAFVRVPRVARCKDGEAAAVWFFGRDNPYGMPGEVISAALKNINAQREIKRRVYGIAERIKGRMFPEFTRERNVVPAAAIPRKLARIMVVDPAPERNWTSGWYGYDPETDTLYKYRDWPGNYEIPGVGVPGPWAVRSDRKNGINDGDKGEAQESFGMGFLAYKYEWARLERWNDFMAWAARGNDPMEWPDDWDEVAGWSELNGTSEPMVWRVIDARAASQSKISARENVSLFDEVSRLAEGFMPASGQKIGVGLNILRDRIAAGRYKVCADCTNTIFSYENYCGVDGQKGACKDFMDCDRYGILSGVCELGAEYATDPGAPRVVERKKTVDTLFGGGGRIRAGGF